MSKVLFVNACVRGERSRTLKLARRFLENWQRNHSDGVITQVDLCKDRPVPQYPEVLAQRDELWNAGKLDDPMFDLARQFRDAEEILIAAPYWDLAFPALLKVYLERVSVSGLTFGYTPDGRCVGHCGARRLLYFSTCGGPKGDNLGFAYVKALAGMLGIGTCVPHVLEGLDIDPARREAILAEAVARLERGE